METLVIVAQHRNQYYRRGKSHHRFSSSPSRGFKEINCRAFQSGTGILPTPFKSFNTSSSLINKNSSSSSPHPSHRKTDKYFENNGKSIPIPIKIKPCNNEKSFNNGYSLKSSCNNTSSSSSSSSSLNKKPFSSPPTSPPHSHREEINGGKSISIPIDFSYTDDLSKYSELWAGPAYSNSPPPSSLPIPTFSLRRQKRSVSVEIPVLRSEIIVHPVAKSAPPSPTRGMCRSPPDNFCLSTSTTASATKDLRRILHLDAGDDE